MARPIRSSRKKGSKPNPFEKHSKGRAAPTKPAKQEAAKVTPPTPVSASAPDKHVRKSKPGETKRIKDARKLASTYLEQRDGMDPDTANAVAAGLEPDQLAELITEANTAVLSRLPGTGSAPGSPVEPVHSTAAPSPLTAAASEQALGLPFGAGGERGGQLFPNQIQVPADEDPGDVPSFDTIPALAEIEVPAPWDTTGTEMMGFAALLTATIRESRAKNDAEKRYKALKAQLYQLMGFAGVEQVAVGAAKLTAYTGHTLTLNENLLLQAGVDIALIKKGWKDTEWPDVRICVPKSDK